MKNELIEIIPEINGDDLIIRLSATLKVDDEETGETLSKAISLEYPLGIQADTEDDKKALIMQSAEYNSAKTDLESILLIKRTARIKPIQPDPIVIPESDTKMRWYEAIDATVANICTKFTRFQMGYIERESAARAYKESNYTIAPTEWVTRFADNVGMSYPDATDRILEQADLFRTALRELENLRMDKYLVLQAVTMGDAQAEYDRIIRSCFEIDKRLK